MFEKYSQASCSFRLRMIEVSAASVFTLEDWNHRRPAVAMQPRFSGLKKGHKMKRTAGELAYVNVARCLMCTK